MSRAECKQEVLQNGTQLKPRVEEVSQLAEAMFFFMAEIVI